MKWLLILLTIGLVGGWIFVNRRKTGQSPEGSFTAPEEPAELALISTSEEAEPTQLELQKTISESTPLAQPETPSVTPSADKHSVVSEVVEKTAFIPEDSVLKRHYLSTQQAQRLALSHPYPTDSVLLRHYKSQFAFLGTNSVSAAVSEQPVEVAVPLPSTLEENVIPAASVQEVQAVKILPEDATLRRHYLTQLEAESQLIVSSK
jgi:hypothetical protein